MKIGQYFYLAEFLRSGTAARYEIDMRPPEYVVHNLKRLVRDVLDPLRHTLGKPIQITSGYRPLILNKIIGGASTSYHLDGLAADFLVNEVMPFNVVYRLRDMKIKAVDKAIDEFNQWTHVQIARDNTQKPRGEYLMARKKNGKTVYDVFR